MFFNKNKKIKELSDIITDLQNKIKEGEERYEFISSFLFSNLEKDRNLHEQVAVLRDKCLGYRDKITDLLLKLEKKDEKEFSSKID